MLKEVPRGRFISSDRITEKVCEGRPWDNQPAHSLVLRILEDAALDGVLFKMMRDYTDGYAYPTPTLRKQREQEKARREKRDGAQARLDAAEKRLRRVVARLVVEGDSSCLSLDALDSRITLGLPELVRLLYATSQDRQEIAELAIEFGVERTYYDAAWEDTKEE